MCNRPYGSITCIRSVGMISADFLEDGQHPFS